MIQSERIARTVIAGVVLALTGCTRMAAFPTPKPPSMDAPPQEIVTGSRIPRGTTQAVRDTTQNVDVYSEHEIAADRPVDTREAVRRAIRGR